ncbi:MAG: diphosphomevalonate decarboxylase [Candidatus Micrarchaeota archaeon]|nr:diphosphomevalonate decarboxylase [Candidatus Micrarchaeota archaeon]
MQACWQATPNIAVIKYWGKRDDRLNLPTNSSISVTMDDSLKTVTTVRFGKDLLEDRLILNGKEANPEELGRAVRVLDAVRKAAKIKYKAEVISENNFPTAAGIASSASGFAALACAAADAAGLDATTKQLSIFARLGSGSAARSVIGGFVEWKAGKKKDGSDSYAVQIAPASHWPSLRNIVAIVNPEKKEIGSAKAMQITAKTSPLYPARLKMLPKAAEMMKDAIRRKDLEKFLELTMRESSNLHAVMLDSFPPIIYLNDISRRIMRQVHEFNLQKGKICAGYTFDAGPNAHIYTEEKYQKEIEAIISEIPGVLKTIVCRPGDGPKKLS